MADRWLNDFTSIMSSITETAFDVSILQSGHLAGQQLDPALMNSAYDALSEYLMDLYHTTQDMRRDFNSQLRIQRYQARLAEQRERARQARQQVQEATALVQEDPPVERQPRATKPKSKALKRSALEALMPDDCGICLEKTTRILTIDTCCGHSFCKTCYDAYRVSALTRERRADRVIKCPLCRKVNPKITEYRARKPPTRQAAATVEAAATIEATIEDSMDQVMNSLVAMEI